MTVDTQALAPEQREKFDRDDRTRTRNSQVSHYLFEGSCDSFYTAQASSDTHKVRVEPTFVA